jgi:heme-degrading monooxygenase HmoA
MVFHPDIKPPYYAVIFVNQHSEDLHGYAAMAESMANLAENREGYLGMDSLRNSEGMGVTISYWRDAESIRSWKQQVDHHYAQTLGRERWYQDYHLHIAKIEREYSKDNSEFI